MTNMWMVRCNGGRLVDIFLEHCIVAVGWHETGSLEGCKTRQNVIEKVQTTWPETNFRKAANTGTQLYKIFSAIKIGDRVLTYDSSKRRYHLGRITGGYVFNAQLADAPEYPHHRPVTWESIIERDDLSIRAKNSLGSSLSVFAISSNIIHEIDVLVRGVPVKDSQKRDALEEIEEDSTYLLEDLKSKAREFIKDKLVALDWEEMQELVASILRAMGYKTRISPMGYDRGKDIVASPDGLGLQQPRIVVEVKHRPTSQMGSQEVRSFLGGRHKDDKGLYVSTGGFSKEAKYEADRASIPLTLIDIDELVSLVIENYENLDMEARTLLPLTRIYWPS